MTEDITFCYYSRCKNKKCERHVSHIKKHYIPHSFAFFEDCKHWHYDTHEEYTGAWMNEKANRPIDTLPADGTKVTIKLKTGEIFTECWYHDKPTKSFYKYKHGCFAVDAVEWWRKEVGNDRRTES